MDIQFTGFGKIARLSRDCVITEKIDGTNAHIYITPLDKKTNVINDFKGKEWSVIKNGDFYYGIVPASRKRWISIKDDNFGFAKWVSENAEELLKLGVGKHFGEWWGKGIQRNYGLDEKKFSLFNAKRWAEEKPSCCDIVPILYEGIFDTQSINDTLDHLEANGSVVAPGFMNPEGIVILHKYSGGLFKKTIKDDEVPKSILNNARC